MLFEKSFVDYQSIWLDHDKNCARHTGGLCIGRKLVFKFIHVNERVKVCLL